MTAAILAILAALVPLAVFLIRRRISRADDPETIKENRRNEIHRNVFKADSVPESVRVNDLLRSLKSQNRASGQSGKDTEGGRNV